MSSIDAQAADNFGGKHGSDCSVNRRAGYTDPLGWALRVARKGGTLAAGEGKLIVEYYEGLVRQAHRDGVWSQTSPEFVNEERLWQASDVRAALEER